MTEQAETDLRSIYKYIAFILLEAGIAARQLERIEESIFSLDEMPERFRLFEKEPWHGRGMRQMPIDNFVVFYIPKLNIKQLPLSESCTGEGTLISN